MRSVLATSAGQTMYWRQKIDLHALCCLALLRQVPLLQVLPLVVVVVAVAAEVRLARGDSLRCAVSYNAR
jgi:hypothetical protein